MNFFKRIVHKVGSALVTWATKDQVDTLVNLDRAIASEVNAPVDYTISGELGKHRANPVAKPLADALDAVQPDHVEDANATDAALTQARQSQPQKGT